MEFSPSVNLHAFKSIDPNLFLSFNDTDFLEPTFTFTDGTFQVVFTYDKDIHQRPFKLLFKPSSANDSRFSATLESQS